MHTETLNKLNEKIYEKWNNLLETSGLKPDGQLDTTVLLWDEDKLVATGSRCDNILKCFAVDESYQGEGFTATVITALKKDAFDNGLNHLFLYTKPKNKDMFSSLFFYTIAETDDVVLMENKKSGINSFLDNIHIEENGGVNGSIVMNCNPFTLGHLYLIETAAKECDTLYVFVVSEDKSRFSAADRFEMVRLGTKHIPNVKVLPTGPYLISSATFPTYFLKDRENAEKIKCATDIEIFTKYFVPKFMIKRRYVGTEPLSQMTNQYNETLRELLPQRGIELREIPRLETHGMPVSASRVRELIDAKNIQELKEILPETTFVYLKNKGIIQE